MRIKKRGLFLCIAAPMVATGFAIFLATKNTTARYVSLFFAMSGKKDPVHGCYMKADVDFNSQARSSAVPCVRCLGRLRVAYSDELCPCLSYRYQLVCYQCSE